MAIELKGVEPKSATPSKPKVLIYGKPGVGKTWASLDFPKVYYIDSEGGADLERYTDKLLKSDGRYFGIEQGSLSFEEVVQQVQALATLDHKYKTLVIDSITKIFNLEVAKEADRLGEKNAFGADKKPAIAYMRKLVSWLTRLDMNVILIAHEKAEWKNGEQVGETFDCWDKLEYELHLCLNIARQGARRVAKVRKSRLQGFPDLSSFDWSYAEFAERYGKDVIERQGEKLDLATEQQISEVKRLLGIVKLSDSTKDKWIADNVDSLSEVDAEKVKGIIAHLVSKTQPVSA